MSRDTFNLKKNVLFSVVTFVVNVAVVVLGYKLVIYFHGLESVGLWSLLVAWASLARLGDVGMGGAVIRFVSSLDKTAAPVKVKQYLDTAFVMNLVAFSLLSAIGYWVLNLLLPSLVNDSAVLGAKSLLVIVFLSMFASSMASVVIASLQSVHLGYVGSYISMIGNVIQIVLVVLWVPKLGVAGLGWAQFAQFAFMALVGWWLVSKNIGDRSCIPTGFSLAVLREMLSFSIKAQVANVLNGLFEPVSKILMGQFGDLKVQGAYELAYKVVSLTRNAVVTGLFASLPVLTNMLANSASEARAFYVSSQAKVNKAMLFVLGFVVLVSPVVSWIWIGDINHQFMGFVLLVGAGYWVNTRGATAYNLGMATGRMRNNIFVSAVMIFVLLVTGFILSAWVGMFGPAFSVAISLSVGGILIKSLNERFLQPEAA